ncbi:MAG: flagellar FlbD family protein [Acidobacteriia bacterium]|nr:flagellar FlbD family protein [Terriglobia bacterium]
MIRLTRLNNQPLAVNCDLIKFVENAPDTLVTLLNGEKIVVRESLEEITTRIVAFRREVLSGLGLTGTDPVSQFNAVTIPTKPSHMREPRGDDSRG